MIIKFIRWEIEQTYHTGLYLSCLTWCLVIPDICGALENRDGKSHPNSYKRWFDSCVQGLPFSSEEFSNFRNHFLHQGSTRKDVSNPKECDQILITFPDKSGNSINLPLVAWNEKDKAAKTYKMVELETIYKAILFGVDKWETAIQENKIVQDNLRKSINFYPNGFPPIYMGRQLIT